MLFSEGGSSVFPFLLVERLLMLYEGLLFVHSGEEVKSVDIMMIMRVVVDSMGVERK